jgi:hypothetical protein
MSKHNFLCLDGPSAVSIKSASRHVVLSELLFLHPMGSAGHVVPNFYFCLQPVGFVGHVVHSGASRATVSIKSASRQVVLPVLSELVFLHEMGYAGHVVPNFCFCLHSMGFVGHVVHSGAFGAQNIDTLFFILG